MPWVCNSVLLPVWRPAPPVIAPLVHHVQHRGIGHRFRKRLVGWGVPHAAAVTAWRSTVTCVWLAAPVGAGGVAWTWWPSGLWSGPGGSSDFLGPIPGEGAGEVVNVPEPGTLMLWVFGVGCLIAINEGRRQAMSKRARVTEFTGWPPPPPRIEPLLGEDELTGAKAMLLGAFMGLVAWLGIILVCAWHWNLL